MKRGVLKGGLSLALVAGFLTLNTTLDAFADSEASRQNSSSAATQNHSEASVEAGRTTHTNQTPVRTTNTRVNTIQPGVKTSNTTKHSGRRHHSGNSRRSYMINTIQQAARTK